MTNKFKIGDIVREIRDVAKLDADGNFTFNKNGVAVETKAWSHYTLEIVAVPDGKRKRFAATTEWGHTRHFSEKSLELASNIDPHQICEKLENHVLVLRTKDGA